MKCDAVRQFRDKLAKDQTVLGLWVTLESASITEMAVGLGLDWVVIDAEHGHLDWRDILDHVRATVRSSTLALVRVAEANIGLVKRALDIGADGVVLPWIETEDELRRAVKFAQYPPKGLRGIGAERATCWGQCFVEHVRQADQNVLVVPIIETVTAGRNARALAEVEGVDVFYFGPADYSSTAGYPGQWEGPGVAERILAAKDVIRSKGKHCGVVTTSHENLLQRQKQGFQMLALGLDGGLLLRSLHAALAVVGRDRALHSDLGGGPVAAPAAPLEKPPANMRPDRPEVMCPLHEAVPIEIARGVRFQCQVGSHNQARNLTTGIVTFAPDARLPQHRHTFAESVTLLSGSIAFEVEGRRYTLRAMDNVVVPPGSVHQVQNLLADGDSVAHIAMATHEPGRELVDRFYSRRVMPDDSTGLPGAERVNRFATAPRFPAGPNTEFIDFFNAELMPGMTMSGGYGLFHHGGRLPAHVHDFDESICIIQGDATCVVEGRKYEMRDLATALQPRGRVHYFINLTHQPMAMLWVYAGPMPQRIVVDERCATVEGDPWRTAP